MLLNLEYALKCDAFVCTLMSNWCRLIDELRATVGESMLEITLWFSRTQYTALKTTYLSQYSSPQHIYSIIFYFILFCSVLLGNRAHLPYVDLSVESCGKAMCFNEGVKDFEW